MSLQIQPQYVRNDGRIVILTLPPSFVLKHSVRSENVFIHHFTTRGIVFSIIHGDEMTVFCCAVQISMLPQRGETRIEITSSETQMKYFTENLSRRLPRLIWLLDNQVMFDDDLQADLLKEIKNDVEVVLLTSNLFMVMFDSTIYFFRIDFENEVFCFMLPLWKLNQTNYMDDDKGIPDLSCHFDSFRFFTGFNVYKDHFDFDVYSDVVNENSCMCASVRVHFDDDDDTLETMVECSRRLFSRGGDDSLFSSKTEPDFEETVFSDKTLQIRDEDSEEDSEEEYLDEEDSDEDSILAVPSEYGTRYVFEMVDDIYFHCIIFLNGIVYLLQVDRYNLSRLKSSNSEELIDRFERDSVDFSERLQEFGEVDLSCRIVIADPIQITCDFENIAGRIVLTKQLIIENNQLIIRPPVETGSDEE
jgi:hypothetical protein